MVVVLCRADDLQVAGRSSWGGSGRYSRIISANCGANMYLLISCDNGRTWGTGRGCTGRMREYADSTMRPIGTSSDLPTQESTLNWVGGRTLLGFVRNNPWSSDCSSPCGSLVEMYSKDLDSAGHSLTPTSEVKLSMRLQSITLLCLPGCITPVLDTSGLCFMVIGSYGHICADGQTGYF